MVDVQQLIFNGLSDIIIVLVGALITYLVAFVKQHFSAKQINTACLIAQESVAFVTQVAKQLGIEENSDKLNKALEKAKELASKAGVKLSDSQWEMLLESAVKTIKDKAEPLTTIVNTTPTTQLSENDIKVIVQEEVKNSTTVSVEEVSNIVIPLIEEQIKNISVSVNVQKQDGQSEQTEQKDII